MLLAQYLQTSTALYVTLTTRAHGRFSDNAFAMPPGERRLSFVPLGTPDPKGLAASLRVEHLQPYLSHQPAAPADPAAPAAAAAKAVSVSSSPAPGVDCTMQLHASWQSFIAWMMNEK